MSNRSRNAPLRAPGSTPASSSAARASLRPRAPSSRGLCAGCSTAASLFLVSDAGHSTPTHRDPQRTKSRAVDYASPVTSEEIMKLRVTLLSSARCRPEPATSRHRRAIRMSFARRRTTTRRTPSSAAQDRARPPRRKLLGASANIVISEDRKTAYVVNHHGAMRTTNCSTPVTAAVGLAASEGYVHHRHAESHLTEDGGNRITLSTARPAAWRWNSRLSSA